MRKNPNLQDPGAQAPGQIKKKEKESYKLQAASAKRHEKDTIK